MPWVQITLHTDPEHTETLEDMLLLCGAGAVTMLDGADQPVFEPIKGTTPLWQDTRVMGLFEADADADALVEYLKNGWNAYYAGQAFPKHKIEILEDHIDRVIRYLLAQRYHEKSWIIALVTILPYGIRFGTDIC